ncbi:MAG TPA: bifunctional diguanylate cyclase/phosphodiesterase, partial [Pseudomonadales bacterium]
RLREHMKLASQNDTRLCIALVDLARFKNINDTLGRGSGDVLLRLVAEWMIRNAGSPDQVARVGADQFIVLFVIKPQGDLNKLFESVNRTLEESNFKVNDTTLRIAARSGIALYPDDGTDADVLLRNAEAALKEAKSSNVRFKFYTPSMNVQVANRLAMENLLRQAIGNDEFVLYYQPKANLLTGKITGAEALIRWNRPEGSLVLPGDFISILEDTGMIADVGQWALRTALADHQRWRRTGLPPVRIAVNVSPLQLNNRNFIADLQREEALDSAGAAGLEIEITESVIMNDIEGNTARLKALRAMGITVAIDDFGTGFSSLGYLAKLPVDTLKIDRSFIVDMTGGPEGLALVSTIIGLAHALNLKVVAEGVENEEQKRLLRLLKCDEMQGFALSPALPVADFENIFLREDYRLPVG